MKRWINCMLVVLMMAASAWAGSQPFTPPPNRNAALRYWMAFADLQDHPADQATTALMEQVLEGSANWDEQRLGPIVEANSAAVLSMQRGSELPECNWGLDYSRGEAMSLGHLPKARVLARLNALYGARQIAQGDTAGAVATWLAGLRFAQCVSKGVGLIGILSAKPAFMANLHLITRAAQSGLTGELQRQVTAQLRKLPADGLDWASSIRAEAWADQQSLRNLATSTNFQQTYKDFYGTPAPEAAHPPTAGEIEAFAALMNEIVAAFQLSHEQAEEKLKSLMARADQMNPAVRSVIPGYLKMNDNREQVVREQQGLLKVLKSK
ncbi:MAG TPA: hypothetical protein VJN64_15250 [Terriglobales bacterium]|nr:hypothetical protein [Terriglobales bacterium]